MTSRSFAAIPSLPSRLPPAARRAAADRIWPILLNRATARLGWDEPSCHTEQQPRAALPPRSEARQDTRTPDNAS